MARNGSGTYTLPSGNPVVSGTVIEANWANTTLSDLATAMTDSLSRSGSGGMTAALRIADGTQASPGLGFANETGSGFYRAGTAEVWAVIQGAQVLNLDATGVYVPAAKTTTIDGAFVFNEAGADKDARFEGDTDVNLLFTDASTDRVGVGTNTPSVKFHVAGDALLDGAVVINETGADKDTRIEGDTDVNLVFVDASTDRVGIGTSSPAEKLQVNGTAALFNNTAGTFDLKLYQTDRYDGRITVNSSGMEISQRQALPLLFLTSDTERARIDSSGNLGIGTTSIGERLVVNGNASVDVYKLRSNTATPASTDSFIYRPADNTLAFGTASTERARITSGGYSKFSNDGTYVSSTGTYHEMRNTASEWVLRASNTNATPYGVLVVHSTDTNGTGSDFLYCQGAATLRASIRSNGGLANYSANDVNLSDRREKTNFAPAKSYIDAICAIPVQTFNYVDQSEDDPGLTLGVVAQDVQAVAPELVMESNWGTKDEPKMRLSIYQTDLQYALMKCIQEQQALITALTARVAALEAQS